jgi:hypothetical protein
MQEDASGFKSSLGCELTESERGLLDRHSEVRNCIDDAQRLATGLGNHDGTL